MSSLSLLRLVRPLALGPWSAVARSLTRCFRSTPQTSFKKKEAMKGHTVKKLGVVGAGQMGTGVAYVAAYDAGLQVLLHDSREDNLEKSHNFMAALLEKNVNREKITRDEMEQTMARVQVVASIEDLEDCDFVVEAASELAQPKEEIFAKLSEITRPDTILASNTSSLSITRLASSTTKPDKVIGMHFMHPVPVMQLVEVIPALTTAKDVIEQTVSLSEDLGKTTVLSADSPGFIANRLLMTYINEAIQACGEGVATIEDIDKCMKLGTNVPMGPLQLADFIGLDTCLTIMQVLYAELGGSRYRPAQLLTKYVEAGWLGKRSGKGFYTYTQ